MAPASVKSRAPAFHAWGQGIFTRFSVKETDAILLSSQDNRRGHGKTGRIMRLARPSTPFFVTKQSRDVCKLQVEHNSPGILTRTIIRNASIGAVG